jgi:hypothetical protein
VDEFRTSGQELSSHLSKKSFRTKFEDGKACRRNSVPMELCPRAVSGTGYYDPGQVANRGRKLCGSLRKAGKFWNDVRMEQSVLYLRRVNREVVRYDAD